MGDSLGSRRQSNFLDIFTSMTLRARQSCCPLTERYGDSLEDVEKHLAKSGFTQALAKRAAEIAASRGNFSIWSVVDALTQLSRDATFAGTRVDADRKASQLLQLVA